MRISFSATWPDLLFRDSDLLLVLDESTKGEGAPRSLDGVFAGTATSPLTTKQAETARPPKGKSLGYPSH
jgi:hypothetical protein